MRALLLSGGFRGERQTATGPEPAAGGVPDFDRPGVCIHASGDGHTVVHADAREFLECLPDNSIPLILTDPPYCSGGATTTSRKAPPSGKYGLEVGMSFEGDARDQRSFLKWSDDWMRRALRKARPDGGMLAVFSDWRQIPVVSDAIQMSGWTWRGLLCWDKRGAGRGLLWGWRGTAEYILWATRGAPPVARAGWPAAKESVIRASSVRQRLHLTEKPLSVLREVIGQVPPDRGPVVDPFCGSGSTLAAAAEMSRGSIGADINPAFCRASADRLGLSPA